MPFAWDPDVFPYYESSGEFDFDVVFIGGWDKEREKWLSPLGEYFDLKIWGPFYWGTRTRRGSSLRRCWQGAAVRDHAAAKILSCSRIALNIFRKQNMPDGVIMRTFEQPGCGAFSLSSRTAGGLEIYPEGEAGAYFSTPEELRAKIIFYLENDSLRIQMAKNAHEITEKAHTYLHRANKVLAMYAHIMQNKSI